MSDISWFIVSAIEFKKNSSKAQGMCEKFLDRFYCNNDMSTICQTKLGLFSIKLR